jgi:O-methyltransferase involved in polyketide biosynthesis
VLENSGSGSSITFDYVCASALTAVHKRAEITRIQRAKSYTGEGLVFGIEEGQVEEFLLARGYTQVQNVTGQDLARIYFTGANEARVIASIYAIAHAVVRKQSLRLS